jgi:cellulose synthase/poly-beta-1,6-N-acetylglucosamine synthase-like glycosyltransferase
MPPSRVPVVSVVIPTFNRAALLPTTIASVTGQSLEDVEVVVVDDGSTDHTASIVGAIRDPRVVYIWQSNAGRSQARASGFAASTGRYVAFLDSDDWLLPDALRRMSHLLDTRPDLDWVGGGIVFSDDDGRVIADRMPWLSDPIVDFANLVFGCPMVPSSVLMRRSTFAASGGFDKQVETAEDWDLWIRLVKAGHRFGWVKAPVCRYRVHTGNSVTGSPVAGGVLHGRSMIGVLDKVFSAPDLPPHIAAMRDQAYATAHVRGACLAFVSGHVADARRHLEQATNLDPGWLREDGQRLFDWLVGGAGSPFVDQPGRFIGAVFANLPDAAAVLRSRWRQARGLAAMTTFYRAHKQGRRAQVRSAFVRAVLADPSWLKNRGALVTWLEAVVGNTTIEGLRRVARSRAAQPLATDRADVRRKQGLLSEDGHRRDERDPWWRGDVILAGPGISTELDPNYLPVSAARRRSPLRG